jgi:hypothetical protein
MPPAVWLDKFSEGFRVELSTGAATNVFEHESLSFPSPIIKDCREAINFTKARRDSLPSTESVSLFAARSGAIVIRCVERFFSLFV